MNIEDHQIFKAGIDLEEAGRDSPGEEREVTDEESTGRGHGQWHLLLLGLVVMRFPIKGAPCSDAAGNLATDPRLCRCVAGVAFVLRAWRYHGPAQWFRGLTN
jgi:hypothetical protein